jgi:hypothetical protein
MPAIYGEKVFLDQENGDEVELVVWGDEFYARYETEDGYPVLYDADRGLFCYALLCEGSYVSSGVVLDQPPPPGMERHARESDEVRLAKAAVRRAEMSPPDDELRSFSASEPSESGGSTQTTAGEVESRQA